MALSPDQLKQNAAAMIAFADGKPIEYRLETDFGKFAEDWGPTSNLRRIDCIPHRPKPELKTRPWSKPEDVPGPVCWVRVVGQTYTCALITGVDSDGFVNFDPSMDRGDCITRWANLNHAPHEYSIDRKTWHKCEVSE